MTVPSPLQVLVVDDDVDVAESVAAIIEGWGHRATTIYDGFEVLHNALRILPDVILLDLGLPGVNGYQAAALVRQERLLDHTRLVALTGWGSDAHKQASRHAGFDVYLTKPVSPEALMQVLAAVGPREHAPDPQRQV